MWSEGVEKHVDEIIRRQGGTIANILKPRTSSPSKSISLASFLRQPLSAPSARGRRVSESTRSTSAPYDTSPCTVVPSASSRAQARATAGLRAASANAADKFMEKFRLPAFLNRPARARPLLAGCGRAVHPTPCSA